MPPLAPHGEKGSSRQRQAPSAAAAAAAARREAQRSASFHGRAAEQRHQLKKRPETQPDLLAGARARSRRFAASGDTAEPAVRRMPSKVLVSVAVQQSMWPLHVMASTEWAVADLAAAAVALYVKEGRRPPLPAADPSAFGLHYSQFSLESLDPKEKVMELGSRSFFLCSKATAIAAASSPTGATEASPKATETPCLYYMQFWPLL